MLLKLTMNYAYGKIKEPTLKRSPIVVKNEYQEKTEKYEFLREEYRISLEEKRVNKPLYNEYTKAKDEYEKAKSELSSAEKEYEVLSSKVGNLRDIIREKEESAFEEYQKVENHWIFRKCRLVEKCKNCGKEKQILIPHCPNCGA